MLLTPDEISRYSQQLTLLPVGLKGQLKLKEAKVLCVGAGGLGSSLLFYLAAAGIGTLGIVDHDVVELSNLHRQILYRHSDLGHKKAIMARERLLELNPHVDVFAYTEKLDLKNAKDLMSEYDIVADCSDNFATRYLINDVSVCLKKPYVFASISQFQGQCSLFLGNHEHACFRCLFPSEPSGVLNCSEGGVLGVLPGLLGIIQATEIIKWVIGSNDGLAGHLLTVDILKMQFRRFQLMKNSDCASCVLG